MWISLYAETEFKNMWLGWGRSTLEGLSTFMEYAIPSVFIECSHWWSLQILVFVCGYDQISGKMAQQNSSSQMAILSLFTFTFMFPLGLSYTISGMVGSFIGQRRYEEALRYAKVGYFYGMGLTILILVLVSSQRSMFIKMFQGDEKQASKLHHCMFIVYVIVLLQSSYGILIGIVKGLGLQYRASLITTICYFGIALALAQFLGSSYVSFFKLENSKYLSQIHGCIGYNIGFMIGVLVLNISLFYLLNSVSWEDICKRLTAYHDLVNEMSFRK